jgi:hypothetical protein
MERGSRFSVKGVHINEDRWELQHRPNNYCAVYNRYDVTSHPIHRHFDQEAKEKVQSGWLIDRHVIFSIYLPTK